MLSCVIFEDEHLLVVNKPAGVNTHAPSPFAGEGIYDWLKHREPRWADLAILHRLDKETSGVMVFGKTQLANRSLTAQFTERSVRKKYLLLTDKQAPKRELIVKSRIVRAGERYQSSPAGEPAETRFRPAATSSSVGDSKSRMRLPAEAGVPIEAEPFTGRTHQIRVHAAEHGFPILGDTLYGGSPRSRVYLHAAEIRFRHPAEDREVTFRAAVDFTADSRALLRTAFIDPNETNAWRVIHGASDGWAGWYVERLGDFLLSQSERELTSEQLKVIQDLRSTIYDFRPDEKSSIDLDSDPHSATHNPHFALYHKTLIRHIRRTSAPQASPQLISGEAAPERFLIRENGVAFELSFTEGYSVGVFLDQRDNRRRLLTGHVAAEFNLNPSSGKKLEILNTFAYTCGFSVCAARAGAHTTSLDLSRKYLDWGRRNFEVNGLDPREHDFIYGDAFDWMRRLTKKNRHFDLIILDPPTFSQSKETGVFRVEKDLAKLVTVAMPLMNANGVLLASSNAAEWEAEDFVQQVTDAVKQAGRKITQQHYVPQPPDFPLSRAEPAYLKTLWLRIA